MNQLSLWSERTPIATDETVEQLLRAGAPVAIGISGGKDSCELAFSTNEYLDSIFHTGPRILIHSHLGMVEWFDSRPTCLRLSEALGLPFIEVGRAAGGLMERWEQRWQNNLTRYINLNCVKMILPWSTPSMRFCTSELKTSVICRELTHLFPNQTIVSCSGIRRAESSSRAKAPVWKEQSKLTSVTHGTRGIDWHPIIDYSTEEVYERLKRRGFRLHEAYERYGSSRVSCIFCIMSSRADLLAATTCQENSVLYNRMVELEIVSTFGFQEAGYLGDVAPHLLESDRHARLLLAKQRARKREAIESKIPSHLLYTKGWPTAMPTLDEAELLSEVRCEVAKVMGLSIQYTTAEQIRSRYAQLMELNTKKQKAKAKKAKREYTQLAPCSDEEFEMAA